MCQIFTVQKYRFGNIISTPQEMCVHELYTIESSNMTWKMKTSTRTINNYYSNWVWGGGFDGENCLYGNLCRVYLYIS